MQNTTAQLERPATLINVTSPIKQSHGSVAFWDSRATMIFLKKIEPDDVQHQVRKVLIVDHSDTGFELIRNCLTNGVSESGYRYEILNAQDRDSANRMIMFSHPDLVVMDWSTMIASNGNRSSPLEGKQYTLPILFLLEKNILQHNLVWENNSSGMGIVDYVRKPVELHELRTRINLLLEFNAQIKAIKAENIAIRDSLNLKYLEFHLELLMHSGSVKDKFLEDLSLLFPFLNNEGKSKLKHLVKQFKWALNDENSTNFLMAFDKLNEPLYKTLEALSPGITKNEKRLCAFTLRDQSGSEIAKIMGKTQNCVNVAFARLRARLGISTNKDLKMFLLGLNK
jgi:DNA-binding response OmpR family regulator